MTAYGFTGTREGMTQIQKMVLRHLVSRLPAKSLFNHGAAPGADEQAVEIAVSCGWKPEPFLPEERPNGPKSEDFLERNHKIVDASALIFAAPRTAQEEVRSGTWATVRYARRVGVPVVILDPGGRP